MTMGRDPLTGKHIRKSVYGQTEKEVRKQLTQIAAALDTGTYTEPSKLTVGQWLDIWVNEYLQDVKSGTVDAYKSIVKINLKPGLGAVKLAALSTHAIQTLYNHILREKSISEKTMRNIHGVLHKCLQQALELHYIRFNPADGCKLPRVDKKAIQPLDNSLIEAFLEAIRGHQWETIYKLALFTGMREGEVLGLTWGNVDFENGTIWIDRQLQKNSATGERRLVTTKNDKGRRITPAPTIMDVLRDQRRRQTEWRLQAGQAWENANDLVFMDALGRYLVAQTVYKHYKRIAAQIGIPDARFHDLRHSYAVAALQSGDDIKTVQENLGHHSAAFTLSTYAHVTEQMKRESADRMEQFIKKRGGV